ncbi:MAG: DUF4190 domain-containing protein [Phycisphaeraceae bacterium]
MSTFPPPYSPRQQPMIQPTAAAAVSGLAITALVLSILGFGCPVIAIVGLVLGVMAIGQIDRADGAKKGKGLAIAAIVLGGVGTFASILILLVGLLLPALGAARRTAQQMQNTTQVRGLAMGCILYAQGNNEYYPGLDSVGNPQNASVPERFEVLMQHNFFTPDYALSPSENDPTMAKYSGGTVTPSNYSYSMLSLADAGRRREEWKATTNSQAAIVSDRNMGGPTPQRYESIHTSRPGDWRGSVGWNDAHAEFMTSAFMPNTNYGSTTHTNDDLFSAASADDALLVHEGQ